MLFQPEQYRIDMAWGLVPTPKTTENTAWWTDKEYEEIKHKFVKEKKKEKRQDKKYGQMCRFILESGKCSKRKCTFAHTLDELEPKKCLNKNKCRKRENCIYMHPHESLIEFVERTKDLKKSDNKKTHNKPSKNSKRQSGNKRRN